MVSRLVATLIEKTVFENTVRLAKSIQIARTLAVVGAHQKFRCSNALQFRGTIPFQEEKVLSRYGEKSRRSHTQIQRDGKTMADSVENEEWIAVYRYQRIHFAVLLARAKLLQTIITVSYLPYSSYMYQIGKVDSMWFYSTAALAVLAPIMLAVFSRYLNRLIGVIAMNASNDIVRVGYLTFWGSRRNKYLDINDVIPLTEVAGNRKDAVVKFCWFGGKSFLYLPTRNVEIVDQSRASLLFGDLSLFDAKT